MKVSWKKKKTRNGMLRLLQFHCVYYVLWAIVCGILAHVTTSRVGLASGQYVILAKVNRTEIMITTWFLKLKVALGLAWSDFMILLYWIRVRDKKGICFLAFYNWESNKDFWNEFFTVFYLINWANVNLVTIFWFVWFQTNLKRYHLFIFHRLTVRQVLALIRN